MGGSSFDLITQELLNQRQIMEKLEAENRQLRQQLSDLRAGQGIFLEINGKRIALNTLQAASTTLSVDAPIETQEAAQPEKSPSASANASSRHQAKAEVARSGAQQPHITTPLQEENKESAQPTFLEEIMLDEFASALTSPHTALKQPEKKPEQSEEEKKANLRRELMGSFLLE
ncbi:hypothetical protein [Dictyobacter formicarum]|uniref:Uncharacterized protein n=1 Tax=Dictyobacter formicarum TaxID=2778368 RepID=A0ABQ3VDF7_9CHLR|nr:hypothetical protein [Dictyobacter formicarum]GHO84149.1 hypothetical protein KSZ_21550 [Dictyobacter formicarum]